MENPFEENVEGRNNFLNVIENVSKTEIESFAQKVVNAIREQDEDYIEKFIKVKAISDALKLIEDGIKKDVVDEIETTQTLYSNKEFRHLGCTVSLRSGTTKYSFEHNEEWNILMARKKSLDEKIKDLEKKMIEALKYSELIDANGEVIPPAEIISYGESSPIIKMPK